MEPYIEKLLAQLRLGNIEHKIEAITRIQGRAPSLFLLAVLDSQAMIDELTRAKPEKKPALALVQPTLFEIATDPKSNITVSWYALIALAELGDKGDAVAQLLIETAEAFMSWSKESKMGSSVTGAFLEMSVASETVRALSYFTGNNRAKEALIDSLGARIFIGCQKMDSPYRDAMYALAAFGDPSTREHLEYWAAHGDAGDRKAAQLALELFGKATFDEVKAKAEA